MTKGLAIDEADSNVRVNSISPSNVWSKMWVGEGFTDDVILNGAKATVKKSSHFFSLQLHFHFS